MLKIYYTLCQVYKRFYINSSPEFKKGFETFMHLLENGMKKHPQYNAFVECEKLEKENAGLLKEQRYKEREIENLKNKLNEKSLVSQAPTPFFKEYLAAALDSGESFHIYVNMKKETFLNMCSNFTARYSWTSVEECKSMMLQFINSKSAQGFKAYKDEKTALKDNVKIKR